MQSHSKSLGVRNSIREFKGDITQPVTPLFQECPLPPYSSNQCPHSWRIRAIPTSVVRPPQKSLAQTHLLCLCNLRTPSPCPVITLPCNEFNPFFPSPELWVPGGSNYFFFISIHSASIGAPRTPGITTPLRIPPRSGWTKACLHGVYILVRGKHSKWGHEQKW